MANLSDTGILAPMQLARLREGVVRRLFGGLSAPRAALIGARLDLALWVPVALSGGIGAFFISRVEPGAVAFAVAAVVALIGAACWRFGPEAMQFLAAVLTLIACGFLLAGARAHSVASPVLGYRYYGPVEGRIVGIDRSSRDRIRLTLDQVVLADTAPARTPGLVRVSLQGDQSRLAAEPGLRVILTAHLSPPSGPAEPGAYDFRRHAWFSGLGAVGYTRVPVLVLEPPDPSNWLLAGHRARMRLSAAIQARIPGQAGAVASALMTGDRSGIAEATNASMRASNLYHIVSISGLHM
ncbi:ComEC/Rec2 family competence protein, partial [Phaeovulum sp.]|uniref:ComEC/Rec2 family competence protein n=1 Tax=Phaeovulum sp. TaxID=2934796 RepID=UPI0039E63404